MRKVNENEQYIFDYNIAHKAHISEYRYCYAALENYALSDPTPENLMLLGKWFMYFDDGLRYWNGEYFKLSDGYGLRPIEKCYYDEDGEFDYADIIGYELV